MNPKVFPIICDNLVRVASAPFSDDSLVVELFSNGVDKSYETLAVGLLHALAEILHSLMTRSRNLPPLHHTEHTQQKYNNTYLLYNFHFH